MRGGKGVVATVLALVALLVVAVPASSAHQRRLLPTWINPDGNGTVTADIHPGSLTWAACAPDLTGCTRFGRGSEIETRGAPPGTVFRVRNAEGEIGISPEWKGPLKELGPPRVAGIIRANEYASPVPGLWSGGWRGEISEMQLSACETEAGEGCVSITSPHFIRRGCGSSAAFYLNPRFVGWYLRVADQQNGGPHAEAAYAVYSPSGATWGFDQVWGRSRTISVAMAGQIAPAVNPPGGECGPPPPPAATISPEGVARVECAAGCSATLVGTRKGRKHFMTGDIGEQNLLKPGGPLELQLTPAMLASLGAGKVRLTVEIDGQLFAQRPIRSQPS